VAGGGVGELVGGGGGSIGRAPDGAKPLASVRVSDPSSPHRDGSVAGSPKKMPAKGGGGGGGGGGVPDKSQAFEEFKETDGKELNKKLKDNTQLLKEKRTLQKQLAVTINTYKKQIDDCKAGLEARREQVQEGETDEMEFAIVRTLKGFKNEYRQGFEELKMLKSETDYINKQVEIARAELVLRFESWFKASYDDGGAAMDNAMAGGGDTSVDGEVLDDAEKFDRLEVERVMSEDPDSLAYHNAAKNVFRRTTVGAHGKSKRVQGEGPKPV
jgi:hypothetical protein